MSLAKSAGPPATEGRINYRESKGAIRPIRCHACGTNSLQPIYLGNTWRSMCCFLPIENKDFKP